MNLDQIICGNCYDLISKLPDESIQLVITSPPYFQQRDYGGGMGNETNPAEYVGLLVKLMGECLRVLKPNGSIVFNLGDKYQEGSLLLMPYQFALEALKAHPLKLLNMVTWVKSNPTPRQFKRRLVSSTEPFFHFVKSDHYYYNWEAFMADERPQKKRAKASSQLGQKYYGLIETSELHPEQKKMAREELTKVIQEVHNGEIEGFRMKIRGLHAEPFGGQAGGRQIQLEKNGFTIIRIHGNPIKRDVIETPVESLKGSNHPAIYPVKVVSEFIQLLTQAGDVVLDPFMGSGSTAVAAKQLGRHYIGFDLNPDYCRYAEERLSQLDQQPYLLL